MAYRALERLDVGLGLREPGDRVPEADDWPAETVRTMIDVRRIEQVADADAGEPGPPRPYLDERAPSRESGTDGPGTTEKRVAPTRKKVSARG